MSRASGRRDCCSTPGRSSARLWLPFRQRLLQLPHVARCGLTAERSQVVAACLSWRFPGGEVHGRVGPGEQQRTDQRGAHESQGGVVLPGLHKSLSARAWVYRHGVHFRIRGTSARGIHLHGGLPVLDASQRVEQPGVLCQGPATGVPFLEVILSR